MKFNKLFALMLAFSLTVVAGSSVFAQDEEEMTEEEWQMQMDELTVRKNDLTSKSRERSLRFCWSNEISGS
ncbi:MAG: hypothetical protein EDM69_02940 [Chlorobiota bacterium]|nr:MAG: hypothetical protein EDM69_02940 [Chlorobiota bacterium]